MQILDFLRRKVKKPGRLVTAHLRLRIPGLCGVPPYAKKNAQDQGNLADKALDST
jgi:hypothetical protein